MIYLVQTLYYLALGKPIAMRVVDNSTNKLYFLHGDHLVSTSLTTCGNAACGTVGAEFARQFYLPYGSLRATSGGATPTDIGFTGQRLDETGLMFYNARYYHPTLGRFISPDTIVPNPLSPQGFNRYAYTYNNPLRYIDPTGHDIIDAIDFLAGIVYQWARSNIEGHSLGMIHPDILAWVESLAVNPSDAFIAGRAIGGIAAGVQGLVEAIDGGGGLIVGGALICAGSATLACAGGALVSGAGVYVAAAGIGTAGSGITAAAEQIDILFSKAKKGGSEFSYQPLGGANGEDVQTKGFHINSARYKEVTIKAIKNKDGSFSWKVTTTGGKAVDAKTAQGAIDFILAHPEGAVARANGIISSWSWSTDPAYMRAVEEARLIIKALTG